MSKRAKRMVGGKKRVSRPQKEIVMSAPHNIFSHLFLWCQFKRQAKAGGAGAPLYTRRSAHCRKNGHLLLKVGVRYDRTPTRSVCLSDCLTVWLSDCLTVWLSDFLTVWLSDCLTVWLSDCPTVRLSDCLTVWLSDCPAVFTVPLLMVCIPLTGKRKFCLQSLWHQILHSELNIKYIDRNVHIF